MKIFKRKNIILINLMLILLAYLIPIRYLYIYQNDVIKMDSLQVPLLIVIFLGAGMIFYLNNKYRKISLNNNKWIGLTFQIVGILGLLYSGFILGVLYLFRNCCGL